MTDDASRVARLEERMKAVEDWCKDHEDIGTDVALLKKCIETYNGDIRATRQRVDSMHETVLEWTGGLRVMRYFIGGFGLVVVAQFILSIVTT